jgi:hypothetical protein
VLLQRLHEAARDEGAAPLVLVDEIDAHMHPEWQQAIVARLQESFPRVQFIVTTHSPFLALGRTSGELIRFRRHPVTGKVVAEHPPGDTKSKNVTTVLTGYLFGLESTLDYVLQQDLLRKRELSVKTSLTPQESVEMDRLVDSTAAIDPAATSGDPLYPLFVQEMTRRRRAEAGAELPLTAEEAQRQQVLVREVMEQVISARRSAS